MQWIRGGLAQLGEHLLCKQGVVGSIPSSSTKIDWVNTASRLRAKTAGQLEGMVSFKAFVELFGANQRILITGQELMCDWGILVCHREMAVVL
jgi:hypothetical protein